ncbi:MAG: hypothetical protein WCR56_05975 [Bacilli bacterium]|jgi:hypothetical protein
MIKVHILDCGYTFFYEALPFKNKSKNPLAFTHFFRSKKHLIKVPVVSYLIEHSKGLILIDTGWDSEIRVHHLRYEGIMNHFASPGFLPEGEGVAEQLAQTKFRFPAN